jgi:hypothetical protein
MNGPVSIRPAETVALCTPVELTREFPDLSPPVFCQTPRQNVDWTYDPARVNPSQSHEASDLVAGSLFQKIQVARDVNEQSFVKSEIEPSSNTGKICSHSDPFGVITSATEEDLEIGRPDESSRVGEMEARFSIGMKSQSRRTIFVQDNINSRIQVRKVNYWQTSFFNR